MRHPPKIIKYRGAKYERVKTAARVRSRKKLLEFLASQGLEEGKDFHISYEAYGRKVMAYITWTGGLEMRKKMDSDLAWENWPVNRDYNPKSSTSEVQVSYFKAWGWDE